MYPVVLEVLNSLDPAVPRRIIGNFPVCQQCGRRCRNAFAAADSGGNWSFGHARCTPNESAWFPGSSFKSLAEILDWMAHLCVKQEWRSSFVEMIAYVRPEWIAAVDEVERRYFEKREAREKGEAAAAAAAVAAAPVAPVTVTAEVSQ